MTIPARVVASIDERDSLPKEEKSSPYSMTCQNMVSVDDVF